jgi:hypothetical protein
MIAGTIHRPFWDWEGRKYIEVLSGNQVLRIKVPFRYGRVMAKVHGVRPIQDLKLGEPVKVQFENKIWQGQTHRVLVMLEAIDCN